MRVQTIIIICLFFVSIVFSQSKFSRFGRYKLARIQRDVDEFEMCPFKICEYMENYPYTLIHQLVKNVTVIHTFFGSLFNVNFENVEISDRDGGEDDEMIDFGRPICDVFIKTYIPLFMKNVEGIWQFIVNLKDHQQYFTTEICRSDTTINARNLNFCYLKGGNCVQKYQEISLLIFRDGHLEYDRFMFPSSCECRCKI